MQLTKEELQAQGYDFQQKDVFRVYDDIPWGDLLKYLHKLFVSRTGRGIKPKDSQINTYDFLTQKFFGTFLHIDIDFFIMVWLPSW